MRIVENKCIAEPGDSLASIAHECGVDLIELVGLNGGPNKRLEIGQAVNLPAHLEEALRDGDADEIASLANERVDRHGRPIAHGLVAHAQAKREEEKKRRPVRGGAPPKTQPNPPKAKPGEKDDDDDDEND